MQYRPWWLGICPGHTHIHMDHKFLLLLGGIQSSLENHILPSSAWMRIIHDMADGHRGLIYRDHTASTWRYVSSLPQHHSSSSSARHHIEHKIGDFLSTSQHLEQPHVTAPKDFLHLNAIMIVMEDCQRQIMCIIMYHAMPDGPCQSLCSNMEASEPESRAQ